MNDELTDVLSQIKARTEARCLPGGENVHAVTLALAESMAVILSPEQRLMVAEELRRRLLA